MRYQTSGLDLRDRLGGRSGSAGAGYGPGLRWERRSVRGVPTVMSQQLVAVRARKRTVFLVAALSALLPLVGLGAAPRADAADPTLSFVGATNAVGNRLNHSVTLPGGIQAGDTLV